MTRDDALRRVRLAECRECGLPMRFVLLTTTTNRAMPVNARPDERGNVAAHLEGTRLVGFVISKDHRPGPYDPYRFMPHAATCEARKKKKQSSKPTPEPEPRLF